MLATYLTALVVGGLFVGLSAFAGLDKDADAGGHDFDGDLDLDADVDLDADGGEASYGDASHGVRGGPKKRPFNPLLSFRFWTFTSAFFGLTGTLLTLLTASVEPVTLGIAAAMGISAGFGVSWLVRALKSPVSSGVRSLDEYVGQVGSLVLNLKEGGTSKVKLRIEQQNLEFLATSADRLAIPKGTRVVVLGFDGDGKARIAPEQALYLEEK
jgi:membrane protein implicated in regulation of membrane protease activity